MDRGSLVTAFDKVAPDAVLEISGFPDVQYLSPAVGHKVNAGAGGKIFQEFFVNWAWH